MALIETESGDFEAQVQTQEQLMQPAVVTFSVPIDSPQALAGSLNEWKPVNIHIPDGGPLPIEIPAWITRIPDGDGRTVQLEARDASVWLSQIGRDSPWSGAAPVNELLASNTDNFEVRQPNAVLGTGSSLWVGDWGIVTGATVNPPYTLGHTTSIPAPCFQQAIAGTSPTTADATIAFSWPAFHASGASVARVYAYVACDLYRVLRLSWPSAAPNWTLTLNVSRDAGVTWGPDHTITVSYGDFVWEHDVTADVAWAPSDFTTAGNFQVRLTATPSGFTNDNTLARRYVTAVAANVAYAPIYGHTMPILPGAIDPNAPKGSLPAGHKMLNEWFTDLVEQTAYEWAIRPSARLGWATFDWQKSVGGQMSATVTIDGQAIPIAGLEQGVLGIEPRTGIDGMAAVNRVYAQATNSSGVTTSAVADDLVSQAAIGVHELIVSGNSTDSATTLQKLANSTLAARQQSQVAFTVDVPRKPGLWSACRLGATGYFRGRAMPYVPWEGQVRIVARQIDEAAGKMSLTLLPLSQTSAPSKASGFAVAPARTAQQAKFSPLKAKSNQLRQVLLSYWHSRRV